MNVLKLLLAALSALVVLQTALSFIRTRAWWVRIFDFPRAQLTASSVLLLAGLGLANLGFEEPARWEWTLFALLALAVAVQIGRMLPYTPLWRVQVPAARIEHADRPRLRVVISNVCKANTRFDRWLEVVRGARPDVIIAVEIDDGWRSRLTGLDGNYPHQVLQPQPNTYGLGVYSRHPIEHARIKHLVESDVPSLFLTLRLDDDVRVRCVVLHPRPPRPDIGQGSHLRDAELVCAGQIVRRFHSPLLVAGDLNDVAWSHTTHLFQRVAGVLDPRVGRGIFATYHARHWYLRYPLDHVFHSRHFAVAELRRLPDVGSDHFPMLIELVLLADAAEQPDPPKADADDEDAAIDAVEDAEEFKRSETPAERRDRKAADQ